MTNQDLSDKNAFVEKESAREFVEWRTKFQNHQNLFDSAPKWISKETVGKILIG